MLVQSVAVVLNGKAGALLEQDGAGEGLAAAIADAGLTATVIPQHAGTLPERIRLAVDSGADAVLVAGGDGTVACAAELLRGQPVPLGVLPFGTMNLLANDLALPIGDLPAAMRIIAAGQVRAIDVAEVNGHVFLCASMLGTPVQLGRTREKARGAGLRLWSAMARAVLRALSRGRRLRAALVLDGTPVRVRAASLTIVLNALDDSCGRPFGRSVLDGGRFTVYVVERFGPRQIFQLLGRVMLGLRQHEPIAERHAVAVDLVSTAGAVHVMNDGEFRLIQPPLRYRVLPGALRVLAPAA